MSEKEGADATIYSSLAEVISQTVCPVEGDNKFHNISCLKRECSECGVEKFTLLPQETASERNVK